MQPTSINIAIDIHNEPLSVSSQQESLHPNQSEPASCCPRDSFVSTFASSPRHSPYPSHSFPYTTQS